MNRGAPVARRGRAGRGRGASLTARPSASAPGDAPPSSADSATPTTMPTIKTELGASSRGAWGGKFKPKNARRSEAERAVIAEQEAQKQRERAAEEAKARPRGRFRGGRSRGNAMGQRGRAGNSAGMFSQRGDTDSRTKSRDDTRTSRESTNSRFENREPRINADKLGLPAGAEDSENEDNFDFYYEDEKLPGLAPMGIYRTKPKKDAVTVTTAAEMEAQAHAGESSDEEIDFKAAVSTAKGKGPEIPVQNLGSNEIDFENGRKDGDGDDLMNADEIIITTKKSSKSKTKLPVDPEDEQLAADFRLMRNEFSHVKIHDDYGEDQTEEPSEEKIAEEGIAREGRVYLFQFPPVMPPLRVVKKLAVKPDPDSLMANSSLNNNKETILEENEGDNSDLENANPTLDNHSGYVGQMVVRKSGRVEMNWGGITYEMRPALKRDFVTSAVLVEYSDDKKPNHGWHQEETPQNDGRAIGLGKVMGQFILAPKYEDKSEWVIRPEDLEARVQ